VAERTDESAVLGVLERRTSSSLSTLLYDLAYNASFETEFMAMYDHIRNIVTVSILQLLPVMIHHVNARSCRSLKKPGHKLRKGCKKISGMKHNIEILGCLVSGR
jgi:hypothetical protein